MLGGSIAASCASDGDRPDTALTPPVFVDGGSDAGMATDAAADASNQLALCNLAAPSCPDPAAPKCTVVDTPAGYVASCVAVSGAGAAGEPC